MMLALDVKSSLSILSVTDASVLLNISAKDLNKKIAHHPVYGKYFWKHGEDYKTSPLLLALMQMELVGFVEPGEQIVQNILKRAA